MDPIAHDVPPEQMAVYRASALRRVRRRQQAMKRWRERAWGVARAAAELLKAEYGAQRVILFGSLARNDPLSLHSDVDLAVWGLDERTYYRVVSRLLDLDPMVKVDLIMGEQAPRGLLEAIEGEGVAL